MKVARAALLPVLEKGTFIELDKYKQNVRPFIEKLISLNDSQKQFLIEFRNKKFLPELLFEDKEIIHRIQNHPMVMWKLSDNKKGVTPIENMEISR